MFNNKFPVAGALFLGLFSISVYAANWQELPLEVNALRGEPDVTKEGLEIKGNSELLLNKSATYQDIELEARVLIKSYPRAQQDNALFKLRLQRPILTEKIRLVSNEDFIRVVELGIYEPGMPEYPNPLSPSTEGLNVPNYAAGAELQASSFFGAFTAEKVVDGKVDYLSRWVSGEKGPHYLVVDMKEKKNIGFIQMLTGHPTGDQWTHIAKEFTFQYWSQGKWKDLKGVRQQDEPGTMGIIVGCDADGFYNAVHAGDSPNWRLQYHGKNGSVKMLASADKAEGLIEAAEYVFRVSSIGSMISVCCNGELMVAANVVKPVSGNVGIWSGSAANDILLKSVRVRDANSQSYPYASNIDVMIDKTAGSLRFIPFDSKHEVQLRSVQTSQVAIKVKKAIEGQQIYINGKKKSRILLDVSENVIQDVIVEVHSADGSAKHEYCVEVIPVPPSKDYKLAYRDEFNADRFDDEQWYCRIGKRWKSVQSKDNVCVAGGNLEIALTYDKQTDRHITGGVITKKLFGYGYYETRAKLWKHRGWHSAFWQMGYNQYVGFPKSYDGPENNQINEIDGFESTEGGGFSTNLQYHNPRMLFGSVGTRGDVCDDFHVFGWEWTPEYVRYFYDGELVRQIKYLPPHGLQNVWLSCVAHEDAELTDIPGIIYFDYFRYYSRDYGLPQVLDDSVIITRSDKGYFESGTWSQGEYSISHTYNKDTRVSGEAGSEAGWKFVPSDSGRYDVFTWNPYIFTDGAVNEVLYEIAIGGKLCQVVINPIEAGQCWVSLGEHEFVKGSEVVIKLKVNDIGFNRIDAVMLKPCVETNG